MIHTAKFSPFRSGIQKKLLVKRVEIGVVTLILTLIVLTCILSVLLLIHSNSTATKGYELRALRGEQHELSLFNQRLKAEVSSKEALFAIEESQFVQAELTPLRQLVILNTDMKLVQK